LQLLHLLRAQSHCQLTICHSCRPRSAAGWWLQGSCGQNPRRVIGCSRTPERVGVHCTPPEILLRLEWPLTSSLPPA
jgi:hypothetical protein